MSQLDNAKDLRAELIDQILLIESADLLGELKSYLKELTSKGDFWESLDDAQKAHIEKGMADNDAGRHKPFEQVMKKYHAFSQ